MRRIAWVWVVVAGCGRVGFDAVGDADRAAVGDSASGDSADAPPACVMPTLFDSFDAAGPPCGSYGFPTNLANGDRMNSALNIHVPVPNTDIAANCVVPNYTFDGPTFVEVTAVTQVPTGYAQFDVGFATVGMAIEYYRDSDMLEMSTVNRRDVGSAPYDPVAMRWWRMRPQGTTIIGEYSADGRNWTLLGMKDMGAAFMPTANLVFGAGYYGSENAANTTVLAGWNACP